MKHTKSRRPIQAPAYPNAAGRSYFLHKLVDAVTAVISAMGFLTVLIFLFLL